jgi:hypothetical protein
MHWKRYDFLYFINQSKILDTELNYERQDLEPSTGSFHPQSGFSVNLKFFVLNCNGFAVKKGSVTRRVFFEDIKNQIYFLNR